MPKYYCDYCDTYLTHDSPSVRKTHCLTGRKHKENVRLYYQKVLEDQAQRMIDSTTAAYTKAGMIRYNPYAQPGRGVAIPPPAYYPMGQRPGPPGAPGTMPPTMGPGGPMPPMVMTARGPVPTMMGTMPMGMGPVGSVPPVGPMPPMIMPHGPMHQMPDISMRPPTMEMMPMGPTMCYPPPPPEMNK